MLSKHLKKYQAGKPILTTTGPLATERQWEFCGCLSIVPVAGVVVLVVVVVATAVTVDRIDNGS